MPQTIYDKLDSLGRGQVRTFEEIERSMEENRILTRSIRESITAQTEIMREQVVTLEELNRQIREMSYEGAARDEERATREEERAARAEREAELAREHDARMKAADERSEAQHEMFRLAMVQMLDRLSDR